MSTEIYNGTLDKLVPFSTSTKSFRVRYYDNSNNINELFLKKNNKDYFIFMLGKNGEPQIGKNLKVEVMHKDFRGEKIE